jgi:hypothetical protein
MKLLTGVADLEATLLGLGRPVQVFPEFRDPRYDRATTTPGGSP